MVRTVLYIVDMYRQLIEDAAFVTPESLKKLDPSLGTDRGRIYRIVPRDYQRRPWPHFDELDNIQLVRLLEHSNGWHRDTAARLLSERQDAASSGPLTEPVGNSESPQARLLALSSLATLDALSHDLLRDSLDDASPRVREYDRRCETRAKDLRASLRGVPQAR